ncbi:TonB-dependent receptor plug domain-containing protein [Brevundimonas subvibrioides]|uniref:TonB-dependent receptor plug n=1 Tax=Brevundimonas subvibrioides (strain ATCC 15264 / DSM 4735 / LMG 14903 / NBRC 16000 / CB 81) TaxID=633149 RepID=D9QMD8_BRESC|nr:TonB-dependent receptor plug domain-containing protein [Brevundimonas subvibrioides]ADL00108.1 TonB-dependent receptor plug [Brevundimonas subvibrioides ATCC 15264]
MTKTILLATTAILLGAGAAQAQTAPATPSAQTAAPVAEASQQGVLVFTPDFFTDYRPNTALDMVSRVPGFSTQDGDGSRGFEGAVGNILINGARPASKNDSGSSVLGRTLAAQVERIELVRGGAPGIDMQGYSVVVNVITRSQSSRQSVVTWNAFLFDGGQDVYNGSYQFTARDGERSWGITLSDGVSTSDSNGSGQVIRRDANGLILRDEFYINDQKGGGQAIRGNYADAFLGGKIDLTARIGQNDYRNFSLQTAPGIRRDNGYSEDGTSGEIGAVYTRPVRAGLTSETRFIREWSDFDGASTSASQIGGTTSPEQRFTSVGNASETILRSLLRWERSPSMTIEGGAEVAYNMLETDQAFTVGGTPVPLPSASVTVEETRGEAFSKATWRIRPDLTLEGGLRLEASTITQSGDADQEKSFYFAKPRFQATWTPMANNQVRFRFEREVGQLDFGDFAASAELEEDNVFGGNVDLEPEQRWVTELVYERRFLGDGIVSVGYRHDEITGVIDQLPLPGDLSAVGNIGDGTLDQLAVNISVPLDWTGFSGGQFTFENEWNKTRVTDPTTGQSRPISGVRASQPAFTISQDITSWKINWAATFLASLRQYSYDPDQTSGFYGDDYFQGFVEYKPTTSISIRAQVTVWNDFNVERTVYASRTGGRPVAFVETRDIDPNTFYQITLKKTF